MTETVGKVIEVFIPEQYKNGNLLDIMDRTNIGFKIMTDNGIREIILECDEENAKIMKDDLAVIIESSEEGNNYISLELYEGDIND